MDADPILETAIPPDERESLRGWLEQAVAREFSTEADCADWLASERDALPASLVEALSRLRGAGGPDAVVIRGLPVDDLPGPTPSTYRHPDTYRIEGADLLHGLVAVHLGEPVGFRGQQNGRLFNDIIPLAEFAERPNHSGGFQNDFRFHTEDSFHPLPPSYFGLFCVRNDDGIPSRFAFVRTAGLGPEDERLLRSSRVRVKLNSAQEVLVDADSLPQLPMIWGPEGDPSFRINLANHDRLDFPDDEVFAAAARFGAALESAAASVALAPGDAVWVDNQRVAHARDAYRPRLDGSDRWMKRLVVVPSLAPLTPLRFAHRILDNDRLADQFAALPPSWDAALPT